MDMESYYVYEIFLPLLLTSFIVFPVIFTGIDLLTEGKELKSLGMFFFLLFLIAQALIPACPFPAAARVLTAGSLILIPLSVLLLLPLRRIRPFWADSFSAAGCLILCTGRILTPYPLVLPVIIASGVLARAMYYGEKRNDHSWKNQQSWIIRSLRESIMILDRNRNIISGGGEIFPSHLVTPGCSLSALIERSEGRENNLQPLRECLGGEGPERGTIKYGTGTYSFRFSPLEGERGYLLTLLDITEEQNLLAELRDKHRMLTNRRTILQSEESGNVTLLRKEEEIRERISHEIQNLVEEELTLLRSRLEEQDLSAGNIRKLQEYAENSMAHIREAVNEVKGEYYGNQHHSGGRSTTDKRLSQTLALGRR